MNNTHKLIIFIPVFIFGCTSYNIEEKKGLQKINSLDMNIFSKNGDKIYSITSPYSSYNKNAIKFESKNTTINIFKDEKIKYIINSDESKLSNNNKILELIGNVELRTLLQDNDILYADNFIWNIDKTKYVLIGKVLFENKNIILSSNKATLGPDNIIEFFNPVKYVIKNENNEKSYEINSENAFYNIITKSVNFKSKDKQVRSKVYL